jgi:hypothetical protein
MAMLMLNEIFERTWGTRAGGRPVYDYWTAIIPEIKRKYPDFKFIAEAYWDLEWELQRQRFDFCYDKRLYDRMEKETADSSRSKDAKPMPPPLLSPRTRCSSVTIKRDKDGIWRSSLWMESALMGRTTWRLPSTESQDGQRPV